ncbi:hypothetical protein RRG08_009520 [Elysia crispata]|uniref:Uncharacterized protein n=1 Tax=Elysia crispata TaxID=231223 RepID=A0AAE1B249_9GAST|nr:hypothetical protein RRG08_009520 [Elysia crispata]
MGYPAWPGLNFSHWSLRPLHNQGGPSTLFAATNGHSLVLDAVGLKRQKSRTLKTGLSLLLRAPFWEKIQGKYRKTNGQLTQNRYLTGQRIN